MRANINLIHGDCMEGLRGMGDDAFELALVDPPYGIGADAKNNGKTSDCHERTSLARLNTYKRTNWDNGIPTQEYFAELRRVSQRQVVWGANHFGMTGGMLFWDKEVTMPTYSRGELAWLSWLKRVDYYRYQWHGMLQGNMKDKEQRIHPTQKPVALYKWLLSNYAKEGDRILDTHLGSASIAIACWDAGFDLTGYELDPDYYAAAIARVAKHKAQGQFEFNDQNGGNQ